MRLLTVGLGAGVAVTGCGAPPGPWRFFTEEEARTAEAVAEQIIPADQDPGATDAGVVRFMDWQLAGFYSPLQADYRNGLAGVNAVSFERHGKSFADLNWDAQTRILQDIEGDRVGGGRWETVSPRGWMRMMVAHAKQGFYGSPRHGGNHRYVSYRMLGVDYPPILGENRYDVF